MHNRAWMQLLQLIPPAKHKTLLLNTTNGVEIAIHSIARAEEDFLVIRGRLTGTTEWQGCLSCRLTGLATSAFKRT